MKKIFTILLAVGSVGFASAQSGSHNYNSGRNDWNGSKDVVVHGQSSRDVYRSNTSNYGGYAYRGKENDDRSQMNNHEFSQENLGEQSHRFGYNEKSRQRGMFERQRGGHFREENPHFSDNGYREGRDDRRYDNRKW